MHGTGSQTILQKDQPKVLQHGDIVALLPDKLAYRIEYSNSDNKYESEVFLVSGLIIITTRMWANAQRDGRPAEHRWRPVFNAAKFG